MTTERKGYIKSIKDLDRDVNDAIRDFKKYGIEYRGKLKDRY